MCLEVTGEITVDSPYAKKLGFTSDIFRSYSYLYGAEPNIIWVSVVSTHTDMRGKGHFRALIENIKAQGLEFRIPTVISRRMVEIANKQGWEFVEDEEGGYFTEAK